MQLCEVKTNGFKGFGKNQGCAAMRLRIDQTSFAFLNLNLDSSDGNLLKRLEMLKTIIENTFAELKLSPEFANHDILLLFGDLNFRTAMSNSELRDQIKAKNFKFIQQFDELQVIKN